MRARKMEQEIKEYLTKYDSGFVQRSQQWHDIRCVTMGGSSIAAVMGLNPHQSLRDIIEEKAGLREFKSTTPMHWGTLFEDVIKAYIEKDKKCTIYGDSSHIYGRWDCVAYSPDGLTCMDIETTYGDGSDKVIIVEPRKVLIEIKCPFSRELKDTMPIYYIPQVKMGLELISIAEFGVFAEAVIRRCTIDDIYTDDHDVTFHKSRFSGSPKGSGVIGFYATPDLFKYEMFFEEYSKDYRFIWSNDLGKCKPKMFELLLQLFNSAAISVHRFAPCIWRQEKIDHDSQITEFKHMCEKNNWTAIGILPYHIYDIRYHLVNRTDKYLDKWIPDIKKIVSMAKACKNENINKRRILADQCIADAFDYMFMEPR